MDTEWVRRRATDLARLLETFKPLGASMVKTFYVHSHWDEQIPPSWRPILQGLTLYELADLLDS